MWNIQFILYMYTYYYYYLYNNRQGQLEDDSDSENGTVVNTASTCPFRKPSTKINSYDK